MIAGITTLYSSVDDIDLYTGGLAESVTSGNIVGPTFSCLIGEHFAQVKYADRYFYELGNQAHSFTSGRISGIFFFNDSWLSINVLSILS